MRVFWTTFLRYQPCDNYSKQNEVAQSSDDNLLPLYGPPYHDSDIIHHTGSDFAFKFSLNSLRFFFSREKLTQKWLQPKTEQFLKLQFDQSNCRGSIFEYLFIIAQLLFQAIFVSVSMKENLRGLRENLWHTIHHTVNNNHVQENHTPKKTTKYHSPKKTTKYHSPKKTTEFIPVEYNKQHKKKPHTLHSKLKPNLGTVKKTLYIRQFLAFSFV